MTDARPRPPTPWIGAIIDWHGVDTAFSPEQVELSRRLFEAENDFVRTLSPEQVEFAWQLMKARAAREASDD